MKTLKDHKVLVSFAFLLVILVSGTFYYWVQYHNGYIYISPRRGEIVEAIYGLGKVKTHRKYEVKVGIMTNVKKVFVQEGESVKKGAPLILFTDSDVFTAPFTGTVTRLDFHPPEVVLPNTSVLTLEDLSDKFIEVSLEQEGALRVRKGQKAYVLFESIRGNKLEGTVNVIFPKNEEFLVHVEVQGLGSNILPGMTADVTIDVARHQDALLVPLAGLSNGQLLVKRPDGTKEKVSVEVGSIDGEWAQIIKGDISTDDQVLMKQSED